MLTCAVGGSRITAHPAAMAIDELRLARDGRKDAIGHG